MPLSSNTYFLILALAAKYCLADAYLTRSQARAGNKSLVLEVTAIFELLPVLRLGVVAVALASMDSA